ncbi:MAG TPA: pyruvate, phosphate dikinase [Candidatus Dormibacteraeota bacterium]|nr:pyruvate, phosphate dikinase [Candidatus Dormibacteraeota bacterium]
MAAARTSSPSKKAAQTAKTSPAATSRNGRATPAGGAVDGGKSTVSGKKASKGRTTSGRTAAKVTAVASRARPSASAARGSAAGKAAGRSSAGPRSAAGRARSRKWVWPFEEGGAHLRDLLGGKGAGVAEMTRAGLPVPPGFTITTEACNEFYRLGRRFPDGLWDQVVTALRRVERKTGKRFGDPRNPLLVSVRSGAKFSMPGMMDTVLNLGLNDQTRDGLADLVGDERFALDAHRRFIQLFSKIVLGIEGELFEHALSEAKERHGARTDADLSPEALRELVATFRGIARERGSGAFPEEPVEQLRAAIGAVFSSWNNKRATDYRNYNRIPHDLGTAVNVQSMVFGNMGDDSGTGVAFTRDPNTGERVLFGEYLLNAQGEDVVAGIRTPQPISAMREQLPVVYRQFEKIAKRLERHYRDIQDLEFTIERGELFMLQTRSGKRTAQAAVKVAVDMVRERLITRQEAVQRVEPMHVDQLLHRRVDPAAPVRILATGLAASPGAAYGKAVFDADRAEAMAKVGEKVILVRIETNPDDVHGMIASQGVLTSRGGRTSHAAVVARGMGKPCVAGAESVKVDLTARSFTAGGVTIREGDEFTIDGSTGNIVAGAVPMIEAEISSELEQLLRWADGMRRLEVWANGDYPRDAERARGFGAQGIGLCRTEHMFMEQERLPVVRRMILAATEEERRVALDELLPMQRADFVGILRAMRGLPVVIRLIDPPLHEFLPSLEELLVEVTRAETEGRPAEEYAEQRRLLAAVRDLHEQNPMLGLRGCRLGLRFPEIIEMQVRAILEAAAQLKREKVDARPEIMIPLVGHVNELRRTHEVLRATADTVLAEAGVKVDYRFGTMIEIPRAALTAGEIAEVAEFFSFGTNDLTQMTFGISRDDAEASFLLRYVEQKILPVNPFESIDPAGVGELMRRAVEDGRRARPKLKIGICGEHGGDPSSIALCEELGLDYVSCSPYRVPVARLAAAQAALAK